MDIKVYLIDDCTIIRDGMKILLESKEGLIVVGNSTHGNDILQQLAEHCPDVVILNISGQFRSGIETIRAIRKNCPTIQIIIIAMQTTNEEVISLLRVGVAGCILAEYVSRDVMNAICAVNSGHRYLSKRISEKLVEDYINKANSMTQNSPLFDLSIREKEVLQLVVEGKTSADIAAILCISIRTVNTYRYRIMEKLNINDLPGLVRFAIQNGLTPP
ncbi:MAG: response regulator transcription factor [Proteobacteria bacterium]|nr:response regulator transcription factor [Pseudomonadota bacterium]